MGDSRNSSMKKSTTISKGTDDCPEESGWTTYFDDFFSNNNREYSATSSGYGTSSLVSDAASCADLKRRSKKLSFKKRRALRVSDDGQDDEALEDTASSPVNSPKISELKHLDTNTRMKDGNLHNYQNGSPSGQYSELQHTDERNELDFMGRENECTELKKRGLCLVPLSMLVNYLG